MITPEINLNGLPKELIKAFKIIGRLIEKNKINIKYKFTIDFELDCYGLFDPSNKHEIRVNPYIFKNARYEEKNAMYYSSDYSILGVCVHEFAHLLDEHLKLLSDYIETFPEPNIISNNCEKGRREELAEVMSLYILNPFFLKKIFPDAYKYFRNVFISPTVNSEKSFITKYNKWPKEIKQDCKEKWGIYPWGDGFRFRSFKLTET